MEVSSNHPGQGLQKSPRDTGCKDPRGFFVNDSFFLLTRGIHQVSSPPKAGAVHFRASAESSATHPARQRRSAGGRFLKW